MRTLLEALIGKKNASQAGIGSMNSKYYYIFIPRTLFIEYECVLGKPISTGHGMFYWVLSIDLLTKLVHNPGVKARWSGEDYVYRIEKNEFYMYDSYELSNIIDSWDYDKKSFNNWPRIPSKELMKL